MVPLDAGSSAARSPRRWLCAGLLSWLLCLPSFSQQPSSSTQQQLMRQVLASESARDALCRTFRLASARSFVTLAALQRLGASERSTQRWKARLDATTQAVCVAAPRADVVLRSFRQLRAAETEMAAGLTQRSGIPRSRALHVAHIAAGKSVHLYERVCRRMPAPVLMRADLAAFNARLQEEAPCSAFVAGGGLVVSPSDIPQTTPEGALPLGAPDWRGDAKECFRTMVQSMRPEQSCNSIAESDAERDLRLAAADLEKALKDLATAFAELDAATKEAEAAAKAAAEDPGNAEKQKDADKAKEKQDREQAEYDAAWDVFEDASAKHDAAHKAAWDEAGDQAKDSGSGLMIAGVFAAAFGNVPLAMVLELGGATTYATGQLIESRGFFGFKDCLLPVQPTASTGIGYLVQPSQGPLPGGLSPEPSQLDRNPPNWSKLYDYCTCTARMGSLSNLACPSAEDREKMDCVANPFGPDDAPRPRCMELLKQDNEAARVRLGACSLMQCPVDTYAVKDAAGTCGCVPRTAVVSQLPGRSACQAMTCAEGSACTCNGGTCACQVRQANLPMPWIVDPPRPPGPRPPSMPSRQPMPR